MPDKNTKTARANADDVEKFIAALDHPAKREIVALRNIIRSVDPAVREGIKWNAPSFYTTEHFATFQLRHKGGVQLVLHMGTKPRPDVQARTSIADPESLLEWRAADRATVTFRDLAEIEKRQAAFVKVMRQWVTFL